jgi:Pyruvate/2-oxoacid:ferredoxin oxidoreductase delta subunit
VPTKNGYRIYARIRNLFQGQKKLDDLIYKKAVLYVMSGTGNTYRVSRWIEEIAQQHNVKAQAVMTEDADFSTDLNQTHNFLLGLLFPTHGFMPPWSMIKFLFRFPRGKNTPAMCVATRGALKIGPFLFWLVPVLPIAYLIIARMFMAKVMFSNNKCIGCGLCARFCPNNAIVMKAAGPKKRPYWTYHCENCLRCMGFCKKKAVEAGHSWAVLLYFIISVPVISYAWMWLHESLSFYPVRSGYWTIEVAYIFSFLLYIIYFLFAVFLSYWIFWHLIQFPVFNKFFSLTTLTHYYRRYHEPDTKLKDLSGNKRKDAPATKLDPEL